MKALVLVCGAALALAACTTVSTAETQHRIDFACAVSVLSAQVAGDIATIAEQHGIKPKKAAKIAKAAQEGQDVVGEICTVVSNATMAM